MASVRRERMKLDMWSLMNALFCSISTSVRLAESMYWSSVLDSCSLRRMTTPFGNIYRSLAKALFRRGRFILTSMKILTMCSSSGVSPSIPAIMGPHRGSAALETPAIQVFVLAPSNHSGRDLFKFVRARIALLFFCVRVRESLFNRV